MAERYDFDAVAADDALLDLLAAGGDGAFELRDNDDAAIQLLAELRLAVEEIDEQPAAVLIDAETFLGRVAARNTGSNDPLARKIATRSLALSVAAVAALSVSGVAAAVGGDPLAPYEKVIERVVDAVSPQTSFPVDKINGFVIGKPREMAKAEKAWIAGRRPGSGELSTGIDDETTVATSEFERSIGLTERTVARPKPPFVLPNEKPSDVKPTAVPDKPGATDDKTGADKTDKGDNGKSEDKGNDKPVDEATPPPATPSEEPTTPVTPPPTEPPASDPTAPPTEDPTPTPSDGGNGQQGQGQQSNDDQSQGNGSQNENNGNGNGKGDGDQTGGAGELDGSATSTPSSEPTPDSTIEPSAELSTTSAETSPSEAQPDPATVVQQSLTEAIRANAAAGKQGKRNHHSVRPADARKVSSHARHARREHGAGRKTPDIVDTRLLAAVTSEALGTVAVLGG